MIGNGEREMHKNKSYEAIAEMDNQHGTAELAWFAGIMDGEGSVMLHRNRSARRSAAGLPPQYLPRLSIANTEPRIISQCKRILASLGVRYCYYEQDKREIGGRQRMTLLLHVTNRDGVRVTLKAIMPFLIGKRRQAIRLLRVIDEWSVLSIIDKQAAYDEISHMNRRVPRLDSVDSSEAMSVGAA